MADTYVTGAAIKQLREKKKMTQQDLASKINVSAKTVSKWETGRGFPDISLLEPLAKTLSVSLPELLEGSFVSNKNKAADIEKIKLYVCPVCQNVIAAIGEVSVSCCGSSLSCIESRTADSAHAISVEKNDGEYFVSMSHPMTKEHYISFLAAIGANYVQVAKLYPEMQAQARFRIDGVKKIVAYCNRHALFCASGKSPKPAF